MDKNKYLLYRIEGEQWQIAPKRLDYIPMEDATLEIGVTIEFKAFWLTEEECKRLNITSL